MPIMLKKLIIHVKESYTGLPRQAWMLALVIFINRSGTMVLFFMILYLTRELGFTVAAAGRMISIYGLGTLIGSYLGGWLSDRIGTQTVQLNSLIFSGIGLVALGYLRTQAAFGATLFLQAIIAESFRPANMTAIARACPPEIRTRGFALQRLAVNLGITIGPALGGFLATMNYRYLFWVDGITCIAAAVFFSAVFRSARNEIGKHEEKRIQETGAPWKDGPYLIILGLLLCLGIIFHQIFNTWPLFLREVYGLIENRIGLLLTVNATLIVLIEMPLIHAVERMNPLRIIRIGILLLTGGFFILPFGNSFPYAVSTVMIWTMGEILVFPLLVSFIANRASDANRGQYMGLFTFVFSLCFIFGPIIGTSVYQNLGPHWLWRGVGIWGIMIWSGFHLFERAYGGSKGASSGDPSTPDT